MITIPPNASFSPLSCVADAVDTDGGSLIPLLVIDGTVDTSVAGESILTYTLHSPNGIPANPKERKVIVKQ